MSETQYLKCPFCENRYVMAQPGKTCCSVCKTEFEIDDRLECVFADPDNVIQQVSFMSIAEQCLLGRLDPRYNLQLKSKVQEIL